MAESEATLRMPVRSTSSARIRPLTRLSKSRRPIVISSTTIQPWRVCEMSDDFSGAGSRFPAAPKYAVAENMRFFTEHFGSLRGLAKQD
jgi:hypothetical protein